MLPSAFHPLYTSAVMLGGIGLLLGGVLLLVRNVAIARAAARNASEGHQLEPLQLLRRLGNAAFGIGLALLGLAVLASAIVSIRVAQCGTVLDLPRCH
jgi:hypothetical protein